MTRLSTQMVGTRGPKGDRGDQGETGIQGPQGPQGEQGLQGDNGIDWLTSGWVVLTQYTTNEAVEHNGSSYICIVSHTSGSTTEPGIGASWQVNWDVLAQKGVDGSGTGDMKSAIYDPTSVSDDAFSMANMNETATEKILTALERAAIALNTAKISYTDATAVAANTAKVGVTVEEQNPPVVSQAEAEAGVATDERTWTAERVKQAIDALGGSATVSTHIFGGFTANGSGVFSHALGREPRNVEFFLESTAADKGYSVGEKVLFNTTVASAGFLMGCFKSATELGWSGDGTPSIPPKTGGAALAIVATSWDVGVSYE